MHAQQLLPERKPVSSILSAVFWSPMA